MWNWMRWRLGIGWTKSCVWISSDHKCFETYYRDEWTGAVRIVQSVPKDRYDKARLNIAVSLSKSREFVENLTREMEAAGLKDAASNQ